MFRLSKTVTFEAAHRLPHHDGKCARLHGHSWKATIVLEGDMLVDEGPKAGMLVDYADMAAPLKALWESHLDHHHLNETTGLENPTSEQLAVWMYWELLPHLPMLRSVVVEETCTSRCEYIPPVLRQGPLAGSPYDLSYHRKERA